MSAALESGATFWNGGEFYGTPESNSCHRLHAYFDRNPQDADKVVLCIKGGMVPRTLTPDGSAQNVRRSVKDCLAALDGKKTIDIFECARVDPHTPIEETISVLAELVNAGKIGGIGLSEVKASTIEKVHALYPVVAVEAELSLWATDVLYNGVAATCGRLGIPLVAYSPLSQGAMAGDGIRRNSEIPDEDFRKSLPKFQDDALRQNVKLLDEVPTVAEVKGVTRAQVAIAWVRACSNRTITLANGDKIQTGTIIPIPGATNPTRVIENCSIVDLTEIEFAQIMDILRTYPVEGERYTKEGMSQCEL